MTDLLPDKGADIAAFTGKIWHSRAEELLATLPSDSVDMIFCDPPYGHGNNDNEDLIHVGARHRKTKTR